MNSYSRRTAVIVLAAALSLPPAAAAAPQPLDRDRGKNDRIVRVIQKIQKLFGVATNDDLPQPPIPQPPPPTKQ